MYYASRVEQLLRASMGIRAHPRLTNGKTSKDHHGTQSRGCAGQTVRPSLHSISQTSVGKTAQAMRASMLANAIASGLRWGRRHRPRIAAAGRRTNTTWPGRCRVGRRP